MKLKKSFWPRELPGATPKVLRILGNGRKLSLNADFSCMSNKDYVLCASPGASALATPQLRRVTGAMQIGNWMDGDGDRHQLPLRLKIKSMGPTQDRFHQIRNERRSYMQRIPRR